MERSREIPGLQTLEPWFVSAVIVAKVVMRLVFTHAGHGWLFNIEPYLADLAIFA